MRLGQNGIGQKGIFVPALEPVAYMWQHDETGRTGFVDAWQLENGWQALNPRLKVVAPLYTKEDWFDAWFSAYLADGGLTHFNITADKESAHAAWCAAIEMTSEPPQTAAQRKAAKPPSTRQAELEARKAAAGLKRVCVWAHPDDAAAIRAAAAELAAKRRQGIG